MGSRAFCKLILRKDRSVNFTRLLTRPPLKGMGCRFDEGFVRNSEAQATELARASLKAGCSDQTTLSIAVRPWRCR